MAGTLRDFCRWAIAAVLTACTVAAAAADPYPVKPVRIIVAVGPGGGDDFTARQVAAKLSEYLGQQFIVENRPGAGGMIGQTFVAKSAPDGYTLLLAGGSMAGARDVREFIALGRSRPGKLTFATHGAGQIPYWAVFWFNSMAGVEAVEVQYKAPGDAILDVVAGRIDYYFAPVVAAVGNREKLRSLAVTARTRSEMLPDVPTMAEAALPAYEMPAWRSLMGPAGMSAEVVQTLNKAVARALAAPDLRERFAKAGSVATPSTPEELRKRYEEWMAIFGSVAKDANIKPH